jgi:proline iminopeptidase
MPGLYPPIEPYDHGMLDVGDGYRIYWETSGNPQGKPALLLHGGPGSGCTPGARRLFDPEAYRIILFDQRGCGRSTPHASAPNIDLSTNTARHLLADIELLRSHLGVDRWLVSGGSWGSTLALAYAEKHPDRVTEIVIFLVATTTWREVEWITRGVGAFFPEAWSRFRNAVPLADRDGSLVEAYYKLLMHPDPAVHEKAARDWCDWEMAIVDLNPGSGPKPRSRYDDAKFRLAFARLVTHYWHHLGWLDDGALLRDIGRIAHIPAVLIHGRLDFGGPLITAWELAQNWPASELIPVASAGHSTNDPGMSETIVAATDRFRTPRSNRS